MIIKQSSQPKIENRVGELLNKNIMEKSNWTEFQKSGLLLFLNTFLHIFGWCIICEMDTETKEITKVYPAKNVDYRGFSHKDQDEAYENLTKYMSENINEIENPFKK